MMDKNARDLFGYVEKLREALANPHLAEFDAVPLDEAKKAALKVAICLGYCRLFGLDPGEDDGILPVPEALGAVEALQIVVQQTMEMVSEYPRLWDSSTCEQEAIDLTTDLLQSRMDIHAAQIAIAEANLEAHVFEEPGADQLDSAWKRCEDYIVQLDELLQSSEVVELLSTITATHLLDNWRALLVEPYSLALPWWLDGTLEQTAARVEAEALATIPGPEEWRRLRRAYVQRGRSLAAKLQQLPAPVAMAAATADVAQAETYMAQWSSPDEKYYARTFVPKVPLQGTLVEIQFVRAADEDVAWELAGKSMKLFGIEATISEEARVSFSLESLIEIARTKPQSELNLQVDGVAWEEWPLEE